MHFRQSRTPGTFPDGRLVGVERLNIAVGQIELRRCVTGCTRIGQDAVGGVPQHDGAVSRLYEW